VAASFEGFPHSIFIVFPICVVLIGTGARLEALGFAIGLLIVALEFPKTREGSWLQGLTAGAVVAVCGFRVQFLTHPAGGYVYLSTLSIPLTIGWIMVILRSREGLRRSLPRPAVQIAIDSVLLLDAVLLALISPQVRAEPIAFFLPFSLLGLIPGAILAAYRRKGPVSVHRIVAFGLAVYGIEGVMKGPLSLSLLAPLAVISLPMVTTSHAFLAPLLFGVHPQPLPRWFSKRGYTQGGFILFLLSLSSALALGAVLAAHQNPAYGLLVLGGFPVLLGVHLSRYRIVSWLSRRVIKGDCNRCSLFGVGFHNVTLHEAVASVEEMLRHPGCSYTVVTPNSTALLQSRRDPSLFAAYQKADLVLADGIGIVWASRLLGLPLKERVTGIDLSEALLERANLNGYRVFLLGGKEGTAAGAAHRLKERFPDLPIVGTHHGYFCNDEEPLAAVRKVDPQILLVGMGVPKQELWMSKHAARLAVPLMVGVGGAFDIFSGRRRRASLRWQRLGLEWFYRVLRQPQRVIGARMITQFIATVLGAWLARQLSLLIALPEEPV
jgi:N-acetylglucosaminyldiphosphoundecaprenol N-acetyl-beta-D-mannosaminyltransferase